MPAKKPVPNAPAAKATRAAAPRAAAKRGAKAAAPSKTSGKRPKETAAALKTRTAAIVAQLAEEYGDAECALHHTNAFQLLIATILSAQCTDERVNMVTPALFKQFPTPAAFAAAPLERIEQAIQSTGFFRNKAKSIKSCSQALVDNHKGQVPKTLEAMVELAGVGRKTANVVLGVAFGLPTGVVVDTHVGRLSRRLGLTANDDPVKVEADLMTLLPQDEWIAFSHRLIHHGRQVCQARKPKCDACRLSPLCPKIGVA